MEAEVKAAQQRAVIPLEDRVQQFKAMLAEKEVTERHNLCVIMQQLTIHTLF
jgi:hypothetical protein